MVLVEYQGLGIKLADILILKVIDNLLTLMGEVEIDIIPATLPHIT